jgi:hypothetical protein
MGYIQSLISFIGLISMIMITYLLNESLFEETDVLQPIGSLCNVNTSGLLSPTGNTSSDSRGLLYGPTMSVRNSSFIAGIMSILCILLGLFAPKIDMNMESTYEKDAVILGGEPVAYVTGIVYRLTALATALLMSMATLYIVPVLQLHQHALTFVEDSAVPESCEGLGLNEVDRLDRLQAMFIASSAAVVMVGITAYSIRYDRKASMA